jgi:acetyltransferase-like isoleucine patch superfamily enzyme
MKDKIKWVLNKTGLEFLITRFFTYGMQAIINNNPNISDYIKNKYSTDQLEKVRTQLLNVGSGVVLNSPIEITHPRSMVIGNNVHIDENSYFYSRAGVIIGDNTHISRNLTLLTSTHKFNGKCLPFDSELIDKPVTIGTNVWIGMNVNILPGVHIGEGAIIETGSTVKNDIPDRAIVSSDAIQFQTYRDHSHYQYLKERKAYAGNKGKMLSKEEKSAYLQTGIQKGGNLFFVLSTGRAGSTTIAKVLSRHRDVTCLHEPKMALVKLSSDLFHGIITEQEAEQELKKLYIDSASMPIGIYGESDQKLSNLVSILHRLLPEAKFLWLIRDPIKTINSTYSRGWFSDCELGFSEEEKLNNALYRGIYSDYRPQADLAGSIDKVVWREMSIFERNCWYWSYWNGLISTELDKLPSNLWMKVKLEELNYHIDDVTNFIGAYDQKLKVFSTNKAESRYKLQDQDSWTGEMNDVFKKRFNNDRHGY